MPYINVKTNVKVSPEKEEALKKILISNIITKRFKTEDNKTILNRVKNLKSKKSKE